LPWNLYLISETIKGEISVFFVYDLPSFKYKGNVLKTKQSPTTITTQGHQNLSLFYPVSRRRHFSLLYKSLTLKGKIHNRMHQVEIQTHEDSYNIYYIL
jgi:hypothetical protein